MSLTIPARPTTYKGIEMRSRLEARYAAMLEANRVDWTYEPRAFANAHGIYLPDFVVPGDPTVFIEVRPTVERAMLAFDRMPIIWDSQPEAYLAIVVPDVPFTFMASSRTRRWEPIPTVPWT